MFFGAPQTLGLHKCDFEGVDTHAVRAGSLVYMSHHMRRNGDRPTSNLLPNSPTSVKHGAFEAHLWPAGRAKLKVFVVPPRSSSALCRHLPLCGGCCARRRGFVRTKSNVRVCRNATPNQINAPRRLLIAPAGSPVSPILQPRCVCGVP